MTSEPIPCLLCPVCHAETVFAIRTPQMRNHCHCSTCGHVWGDEHPPRPEPGEVALRVKRDRRQHCNAKG